jgi:2-C-methyl-D-erythritol 4-phosphate cytidylyltransferase
VETIKDTVGDSVVTTVDRAQLQIAQTPQGFITTRLRAAHERAVADDFHGTDDAQLFERIGGVVRVVEGSTKNLKITTQEDLLLAEAVASRT